MQIWYTSEEGSAAHIIILLVGLTLYLLPWFKLCTNLYKKEEQVYGRKQLTSQQQPYQASGPQRALA